MTFAQTLASEAAEHGAALPFAPLYFGIIALVVFALLFAITWAFRNTAQKVADQRATVRATAAGAHASGVGEHGHR